MQFLLVEKKKKKKTGDDKSEHQHSRDQRTKIDWNGCI